jgi:hypothetical protein
MAPWELSTKFGIATALAVTLGAYPGLAWAEALETLAGFHMTAPIEWPSVREPAAPRAGRHPALDPATMAAAAI